MTQFSLSNHGGQLLPTTNSLPSLFIAAGEQATRRYLEFFTAHIRNRGTRAAYAQVVERFCAWCESHALPLDAIQPIVVATYVEQLMTELSPPTVKLHLAAIRSLFDYMVTGQVVPFNPAASVRGPKHVVRKGKTPVLLPADARLLLDSIETNTLIGLRDRALIGVMVYSFARVSAAIGMNVEDYFMQGRRRWFRLHEKGGKHHEVPVHRRAAEYLDDYLTAAPRNATSPLFPAATRHGLLTDWRLHRTDSLRMIKRRAVAAGLPKEACNHTFRATGITAYLANGGSLEHAQQIAAHESPRSTKLYDRTDDAVSSDEIERILL